MIERFFYETLSEELKKRGFFVVTEQAPENCVGICGINGTENQVMYVECLQKHYRLAAIWRYQFSKSYQNIIFNIGNYGSGECAGGYYEVLVGSRTKEPFPIISINLKYNERYYKMDYQCGNIRDFIADNDGKAATLYIVKCFKFMTSSLMDVLHEWISEGKFPLHRFAEGSEDIITED